MANPAPTVSTINAFNVDGGTIIDFNIVGGTNIVRSNKLYIYDTIDNSLVLTHLYVSTESIHELPTKTDSSIVYVTGKTSASFVNEHQYYASIQTFTDVIGEEGFSGFSTAKLFWTLPTPTLAMDTIPATISTTSYNFVATYNSSISSNIPVTNAPESYQFELYDSSGTLVQTSGVITGSGERVGTSTTYHLSYNFTGLQDLTSYYVKCTVNTSEGMSASATSSTFLVNVNAPVLSGATVINDACRGCITITAELSDSYSSDITKVLVKRLDTEDVKQTWVTLFSIDIIEASDMNFTVVDFYNRYGRIYQYAVVPVLLQTQSGVSVEVEGGYTLSPKVESFFDGVYVADNTAIQRLKAGVGYNDMSLRQEVGEIETIGNQYPVIVSNSHLKYHRGSLSAMAIPDSYYATSEYGVLEDFLTSDAEEILTSSHGVLAAYLYQPTQQLSRTGMVKYRIALEEFMTNKSPKILKDWNGNIWLIMFTSDVTTDFTNEWGMGIATVTASWAEIGDAESQEDLQDCGLIDLGGV